MRLIIKAYNIAIDMDENVVEVIVVENPRVFYEIISNTMRDFENDNKLLFIEDDGRALGNSKYEIVPSPFSINLNNKKMLNAVYKDLEESICTNLYTEFQYINSEVIKLVESAIFELPYNVTYECITDIKNLLKICNIAFDDNSNDILEKLTEYIKLSAKVLKLRCMVFINLHDVLSADELEMLYKECIYNKIHIITIESHERGKNSYERINIIDESECIISY